LDINTIILFIIYCYGLGFGITYFIKPNYDDALEKHIIRFGIGLASLPIIGVIMSFFHIPIDWKIILALSLVIPLFYSLKNISSIKTIFTDISTKIQKIKLKKSQLYIILALVILGISLFVSLKGAFLYPYIEDDDPWTYAVGVDYISKEKTLTEPFKDKEVYQYIDPYPPGYSFVLAVLYQTSDSLMWTLKFFNSMFLSLTLLFFYLFAKQFMSSKKRALISSFILLAIPCFLTHFIWSHSLILLVFFISLYCLERSGKEKLWIIPALLSISGILVIQPTQAIKLSLIIIIYLVVKSVYSHKILINQTKAFIAALLLSLFWWYNKAAAMLTAGGGRRLEEAVTNGIPASFLQNLFLKLKTAFPYDGGTATRAYTFKDYFIAQPQGLINNQPGLGIAISILLLIALIYIISTYKPTLKRYPWITVSLCWLFFTFLGMNSMTFHLPFGLIAWRFWMLFAIPTALLCSLGFSLLSSIGKKTLFKSIITLIIIAAIIMTAGTQKYKLNTSSWPPGVAWTSQEEFQGYLGLKNLPQGTKVFDYSTIPEFVIGYDKEMCSWCETTLDLRYNMMDNDANTLHNKLLSQGYEYLIIGKMSYRYHNIFSEKNNTNDLLSQRISEVLNSTNFQIVFSNKDTTILKVL